MYADGHAFVTRARLVAVGAEQTIPPGQVEAEIAVGFIVLDRMVNPVHVRRNQEPAQDPVNTLRNLHIAVIEHGCRVKHDFE